jgi:four helix bundle protein
MRRSSVSIASNIAEGRHRGTRKDFVQFLRIALGSVAELETQIELTKRTLFKNADCFSEIDIILNEISRMLKVMIRKLST